MRRRSCEAQHLSVRVRVKHHGARVVVLPSAHEVSARAGMLFRCSQTLSSGAAALEAPPALTEGSTSVISVRVLVEIRGACICSSYGVRDAPWPHASIGASWHAVQMLSNPVVGSSGAGGGS